jgi:hypothetical protein
MGIHSEAILNRKYMEMIKLLNVYLNHFPKFEKYALCSNIRNTAYGVYDLITECQKRYYKKTSLVNLDIEHEKLRMQIHLANELGYFNFKDGRKDEKINGVKKYLAISRVIDEIGKIIGAWINKLKQQGNFS